MNRSIFYVNEKTAVYPKLADMSNYIVNNFDVIKDKRVNYKQLENMTTKGIFMNTCLSYTTEKGLKGWLWKCSSIWTNDHNQYNQLNVEKSYFENLIDNLKDWKKENDYNNKIDKFL